VRCLQRDFNRNTQNCDFGANLLLSLPDASYRTSDPLCTNPSGCCYDQGSMEKWWSYYSCSDHLVYPEATWDIKVLCNGTVAVNNVVEISTSVSSTGEQSSSAYNLNFLWFPVSGERCKFRLGYANGNALQCPVLLTNGVDCTACQNPPTP
jgi:hypothetical protein